MRYVFLFLVWITPAHAQEYVFYNYSQWEQLSETARLGYIAGAIDTLSSIASAETIRAAKHYNTCVANAHMNLVQLDGNVRAYVRTKPALQAHPMSFALLDYLVALCGPPPKQ
jgi:hypothetical protein